MPSSFVFWSSLYEYSQRKNKKKIRFFLPPAGDIILRWNFLVWGFSVRDALLPCCGMPTLPLKCADVFPQSVPAFYHKVCRRVASKCADVLPPSVPTVTTQHLSQAQVGCRVDSRQQSRWFVLFVVVAAVGGTLEKLSRI